MWDILLGTYFTADVTQANTSKYKILQIQYYFLDFVFAWKYDEIWKNNLEMCRNNLKIQKGSRDFSCVICCVSAAPPRRCGTETTAAMTRYTVIKAAIIMLLHFINLLMKHRTFMLKSWCLAWTRAFPETRSIRQSNDVAFVLFIITSVSSHYYWTGKFISQASNAVCQDIYRFLNDGKPGNI